MFACLNLLHGHRKFTVYLSCGNFFPEFFFNWSLQYLWLHHFFHSLRFLCVFLLPWPLSKVCLYLVFCKKSDFGFVFLDCVFCFIFVVLSCCFDDSDDLLSLVRRLLLCFWSASNLFVAIYFSVKFLSQVLKAAPLFPEIFKPGKPNPWDWEIKYLQVKFRCNNESCHSTLGILFMEKLYHMLFTRSEHHMG